MRNGEYELVVAPAGYLGKLYRERYAYEHHVVWWENTGEAVEEGYTIHHKNEKKRDNSFQNLQKLAKPIHSLLHAPSPGMLILMCAGCNSEFSRSSRVVKGKRKRGQKDFYCDRSCASRHFGRGRKK